MGLTKKDIEEMNELRKKNPAYDEAILKLKDDILKSSDKAVDEYIEQKTYDEAKEIMGIEEKPRDIHEGRGHYRGFNREKRVRDFGKKQHKKNKQIKKSRARNRK